MVGVVVGTVAGGAAAAGGPDLVVDASVVGLGTVAVAGGRRLAVREVLEAVVPGFRARGARLELWFGLRRYGDEEVASCEVARLAVGGAGLLGGKGGFGAMLRSMGKAGGANATRDFGACRDLSGRRLRHVNDEIALERWHEARARNEARKRSGGGGAGEEEEEDAPTGAHGIRGWHLAVPNWAELPKARKAKSKVRSDARRRNWEDEERDVKASGCTTKDWVGHVTMVDGVHMGFCIVDDDCYVPASANVRGDDDDWSGGGDAPKLRIGDTLQVSAALRPHGRNAWNCYKAERVATASRGGARHAREARVERHIRRPRYVEEALAKKRDAAERKDRRRRNKDDDANAAPACDAAAMRDSVLEGLKKQRCKDTPAPDASHMAVAFEPPPDAKEEDGRLRVLGGDARVAGAVAVGKSEFATVAAAVDAVTRGKWYYEATILTGGVVQVGWALTTAAYNDVDGDGVGDDAHSWAFDGLRGRKWTRGDDAAYGDATCPWKQGDVVGCLLDADAGVAAFSVNGAPLGAAYDSLPTGGVDGFMAALSLEDNEAVRLALRPNDLKFAPPDGYAALDQTPQPSTVDVAAGDAPEAAAAPAAPEAPVPVAVAAAAPVAAAPVEAPPPAAAAAAPEEPPKAPYQKRADVEPEALDLSEETLESLEARGLDRLKAALMAAGLKCGGTARDRAARLLSTRGVERKDWDRKILAKAPRR